MSITITNEAVASSVKATKRTRAKVGQSSINPTGSTLPQFAADIAADAAEAVAGSKSAKRRSAKAKAEAKAQSAKAKLSELLAKFTANSAALESQTGQVKLAANLATAEIDKLIGAVGSPSSPSAIVAALKDVSLVSRVSAFDYSRLQWALCAANAVQACKIRGAEVNGNDADRAEKLRDAYKQACEQSAASLGDNCDANRASIAARTSHVVFRFHWLRTIADSAKVKLSGFAELALSPFAKFDPQTAEFSIAHPCRKATDEAKNADKLTADEEAKLRQIVTDFASGKLSRDEAFDELRKAGFKKAKAQRGPQTDGGNDSGDGSTDEAEGGLPVAVDYASLGSNASADEMKTFVLAYFSANSGKNRVAEIALRDLIVSQVK